jgi:hypothetical protein
MSLDRQRQPLRNDAASPKQGCIVLHDPRMCSPGPAPPKTRMPQPRKRLLGHPVSCSPNHHCAASGALQAKATSGREEQIRHGTTPTTSAGGFLAGGSARKKQTGDEPPKLCWRCPSRQQKWTCVHFQWPRVCFPQWPLIPSMAVSSALSVSLPFSHASKHAHTRPRPGFLPFFPSLSLSFFFPIACLQHLPLLADAHARVPFLSCRSAHHPPSFVLCFPPCLRHGLFFCLHLPAETTCPLVLFPKSPCQDEEQEQQQQQQQQEQQFQQEGEADGASSESKKRPRDVEDDDGVAAKRQATAQVKKTVQV